MKLEVRLEVRVVRLQLQLVARQFLLEVGGAQAALELEGCALQCARGRAVRTTLGLGGAYGQLSPQRGGR